MPIKDEITKDHLNKETQSELDKMEQIEKKVNKENLFDKKDKYSHNSCQFETIRSFRRNIRNNKTTLDETDKG